MKKISHHVIFLSSIIFVLITPWHAFSSPREVTLFSDSALMTEVTKVRLSPLNNEYKKAVFLLPAKADPMSLVCGFAQPTKMQIESLSWRPIYPDDDETLKILRRQLQKMHDENNDLLAHIKALESQIQFWQLQTKAKAKNSNDAAAISATLGRNLKILYKDKLAKEAESAKAEKRIDECRKELSRQEKNKEALWEITLLLSGPQTAETALKYSYLVGGCGWAPHYRIEANTQTKQISFKHETNIWQNTSHRLESGSTAHRRTSGDCRR